MRAVDTNVLVRLLARDDARQAALGEAFIRGGAWVSHLVLMETTWVLASAFGVEHGAIADGIDLLLAHESLVVQDAEVVSAALASYRRRPAISFSDHLILEVARKAGHLPLGTFDKDLGKLDGAERLG
jgi:predicted nucleic-acid-binding protein